MKPEKMVLVDPSHKLPMPGTSRLFSVEGETVDMHNPFWIALRRDGSIEPAPAATATPAAEPAASPHAAEPAAPTPSQLEAAVAALHLAH